MKTPLHNKEIVRAALLLHFPQLSDEHKLSGKLKVDNVLRCFDDAIAERKRNLLLKNAATLERLITYAKKGGSKSSTGEANSSS